jgi:hypothetical protein
MTARPINHADVEAAVARLIGLTFQESHPRRAVDMEIFNFGPLHEWIDKHGRSRSTGDIWLHVQAPWRIVSRDRIVVGYGDYWDPPIGVEAEGFDPSNAPRNRRDELVAAFHAERLTPRSVSDVEARTTGDLCITFDDGSRLEIQPDSIGPRDEYWRLFASGGPHLVVGALGAEEQGD